MNIKVESKVKIEVGVERITLNREEAESLFYQLGEALGKPVVQNPGFLPKPLGARMMEQNGTMAC